MIPLTFCFTTYQRVSLTIKAVNSVIDDPRVQRIMVVDDFSDANVFDQLFHYFRDFPKVDLYRNNENKGMGKNKERAICLSPTEWCIIADSDNEYPKQYIDAIEKIPELESNTIYCPSHAAPSFDFRKFSERTFDKNNIKELVEDPMGNCSMNVCNYLVHRDEYINVYEHNPEMKATDTLFFNMLWLKTGNKFHIVEGMEYFHRTHADSGFLKDVEYNMAKSAELRNKILQDQW